MKAGGRVYKKHSENLKRLLGVEVMLLTENKTYEGKLRYVVNSNPPGFYVNETHIPIRATTLIDARGRTIIANSQYLEAKAQ